jgi:DNA-binding response OmpR family regulator
MPTLNILVVDDDRLNGFFIGKLLDRCSVESSVVTSGQEAMEELAANSYDAVILDYNMPGMSGAECAELIRKQEADNCPVIIGTSADSDNAENTIFDTFLTKPFQMEELERVINFISGRK